jgi:hypothetical protein
MEVAMPCPVIDRVVFHQAVPESLRYPVPIAARRDFEQATVKVGIVDKYLPVVA